MTYLTVEDRPAAELSERHARMVWSALIEPGDADVHTFCELSGGFAAGLAALQAGASPGQAFDTPMGRWAARLSGGLLDRLWGACLRHEIDAIIPGDPEWPAQLEALDEHRPVVLYVRGDARLLTRPRIVAVVGARAATGYGEHVAMELVHGLAAERDCVIVSGGAYGIDAMAHRATLAGHGRTIAVLAGGLDRFYPSGNETLLQRVVESGAVVSEVPPGTAPTKWRFRQRNRLIAAFAAATVVIEAGYRSGSLNTAGHALSLSRPVGAVPGPVTSAASAGCHRLIRDFGAVLVTNAAEVFELAGYVSNNEEGTDD